MKNRTTCVNKIDARKCLYFIAEMSQNISDKGMYGTLAGKTDLMGGILDRWINTLCESVVFDKIILLDIWDTSKPLPRVITDYYKYSPTQETTGIAPDVIGLQVDKKVIPLAVFNEKWVPVGDRPQIEVKSFKKNQQMVSLRDQGYSEKYLVMVETNFRVDYLLPLFEKDLLRCGVYEEMTMNDDIFLVSDSNHYISHLKEVDFKNDNLGSISLLCITTGKDFERISTYCEAGVSPIRITSIEEKDACKGANTNILMSQICNKNEFGLYSFGQNFYDGETEDEIPYLLKGNKQRLCRYLDFYISDPDSVTIIKKNKSNIYIKTTNDVTINEYKLSANKIYLISFVDLPRDGSDSGEYFLQKSLMEFIPEHEEELKEKLKSLIESVDN